MGLHLDQHPAFRRSGITTCFGFLEGHSPNRTLVLNSQRHHHQWHHTALSTTRMRAVAWTGAFHRVDSTCHPSLDQSAFVRCRPRPALSVRSVHDDPEFTRRRLRGRLPLPCRRSHSASNRSTMNLSPRMPSQQPVDLTNSANTQRLALTGKAKCNSNDQDVVAQRHRIRSRNWHPHLGCHLRKHGRMLASPTFTIAILEFVSVIIASTLLMIHRLPSMPTTKSPRYSFSNDFFVVLYVPAVTAIAPRIWLGNAISLALLAKSYLPAPSIICGFLAPTKHQVVHIRALELRSRHWGSFLCGR